MDAGLETIGARCETCHRQDFLPFTCPHCHHSFCLEHTPQAAHGCANLSTATVPAAAAAGARPAKKNESSLKQIQQDHLARRFTPSPSPGRPQQQQPAATASSSTTKESTAGLLADLKARLGKKFVLRAPSKIDVGKAAAEAKIRREAKGDPGIPPASRLTLRVAFRHREEILFVDRGWTVGRAMDAVAKRMDVTNENASTRDETRRLHLWHDGLLLEPSQRVADRVADLGRVVLYRGLDRPTLT